MIKPDFLTLITAVLDASTFSDNTELRMRRASTHLLRQAHASRAAAAGVAVNVLQANLGQA